MQHRTTRSSPRLTRIARALAKWFGRNRRELPWRDRYDPWEVWVSEVMAQQTRMEIVVRRFPAFIARFPTVAAMASSSERAVLTAWSGLGYYGRARRLRLGAIEVVSRFGGVIPDDPRLLRSIPGIGRYTAGAIASIAFGRRAGIVDGNVARLVSRLDAISAPWRSPALQRAAWAFADALAGAARSPRIVNQAAMELGAAVCRPRAPRCGACPLAEDCRALARGRVESYPRPSPAKRAAPIRIPLFVVEGPGGRILMRDGATGLMRAMLHLPHGNRALLPDSSADAFIVGEVLGSVRHSITSRRIEFIVQRARIREGLRDSPVSYVWIDPAEAAEHPLPSYVRKALAVAGLLGPAKE